MDPVRIGLTSAICPKEGIRVYRRPIITQLVARLREPRRFIQVLSGPRQVGKTTLARQALDDLSVPSHYASADEPTLQDRTWLAQQWELGRLRARASTSSEGAILVLDEVQKLPSWSGVVKQAWDEDTRSGLPLKVVLLGSAPLLVQQGLTESLAGRFEVLPVTHWSFVEMREAFDFELDEYLFFGGYPGAAYLRPDPIRWARYVLDSLIETTISRDVLLLSRVDKPALLRRLFQLACTYSGQVLSYQKMVGQLQDVGNTTTLAHYLDLLAGAGMVSGLPKYAGQAVRQRASSPKLQVLNTALLTASSGLGFEDARRDREFWGRLTESAVGAHLLNSSQGTALEVSYWRERSQEVDFVLAAANRLLALEVRSGRVRDSFPGLAAFSAAFPPARSLLVGGQGIPIGEFLEKPAEYWLTA